MRILFTVLFWCFFALPGLADVVPVGEPDWLVPANVPEADPALIEQARNGVFYQLVEHQLTWEGEDRLLYEHVVMQVLSRAGLEEAAAVLRSYDPAYESLGLARLQVRRGDQVIDWKDRLQPDEFRREGQLEDGIVNGLLTAHLQIPDVRVGDIVDVAFLSRRRPAIAQSTYSSILQLGHSEPVGLARLVLNWPAAKPIRLQLAQADALVASDTTEAGIRRLIWELPGVKPMPDEEQVPYGVAHYATVEFSPHFTWQPIVVGLRAAYQRDEPLPADWEARVAAIATAESDDGARAIAALRLVQQEIRYVGVEIGPGGYFARPPAEVIASGSGDCKDKALLLKTILGRLGLQATVALTSLYNGYTLDQTLPRISAFDHMIVGVRIEGAWVWMDPTLNHQGGTLRSAAQPDYGFVLPLLSGGRAALVEIKPASASLAQQVVMETYRFTTAGVELTVRSHFLGVAADNERNTRATYSEQDLRNHHLDYYAQSYPGIVETAAPRFRDDVAANFIEATETYLVPQEALLENGLNEDFPFFTGDFGRFFPRPAAARRRLPLAAMHPISRMQMVFVENAPIDFVPPDPVTIENTGFHFSLATDAHLPGTMRLVWRYDSLARMIDPEQADKVLRDARKVIDKTWFSWDLTAGSGRADAPAAE